MVGLETPPQQIDWAPLPFFYAATFEPYSDKLEMVQTRMRKGAFTPNDLTDRKLVPGSQAPKPVCCSRPGRVCSARLQVWCKSR